MAISVRNISLWRKDVRNSPGVLATVLEPLADAGASLRVVMGYPNADNPDRSTIELFPVAGKKVEAAAASAGLAAAPSACLLVEGEDRAGLGAQIGNAMAAAGINISFLVAQSMSGKFTAVFGFADEATASAAAKVLRSVPRPKGRAAAAAKPAKRNKTKSKARKKRSRR